MRPDWQFFKFPVDKVSYKNYPNFWATLKNTTFELKLLWLLLGEVGQLYSLTSGHTGDVASLNVKSIAWKTGPLKAPFEAGIAFVKKWGNPGLFFLYFCLFKTHIRIFTTIVKNIHPVYGAGIRTHNLWNMSLLP